MKFPKTLDGIRWRWISRRLIALPFEQLCRALNFRCVYCGRQEARSVLTRDHLRPLSKGGTGRRNIVPACRPCNAEKGSMDARQYAEWLRARGRTPDFLLPHLWWGGTSDE